MDLELAEKISLKPFNFDDIKLYIYYSGSSKETLLKIKNLVEPLDRTKIQISVTNCPMSHLKDIEFKGVFVTSEAPTNWKNLCLSEEAQCVRVFDDTNFDNLIFENINVD